MPFGFYTGAGVIFGNSGGVMEAVLRYAAEKATGQKLEQVEFQQVRGDSGLREATVTVNGSELKLAVVHGLRNARVVAEQVRAGKSHYDLIEVMACPGGCIGGAGQPVSTTRDARALRTKGLYHADKMLQLHKSQDNVFITECYAKFLGEIGGEKAHHLLHTSYQSRRRIADESLRADAVARRGQAESECVPGNELLPERLAGDAERRSAPCGAVRIGRAPGCTGGFLF